MDWENWLTPVLIVAALAMVGAVLKSGNGVGSMDSLKETVENSIMEIKNDINKILERLPSRTIAEGSPLTLTELGRLISKELKANEWAQETANELISSVQEKEPYEVRQFCFDYANFDYAKRVASSLLTSSFEKCGKLLTITPSLSRKWKMFWQ